MLSDLLNTYKMGWKTSYYQNTYDYKGEEETVQPPEPPVEEETVEDIETVEVDVDDIIKED